MADPRNSRRGPPLQKIIFRTPCAEPLHRSSSSNTKSALHCGRAAYICVTGARTCWWNVGALLYMDHLLTTYSRSERDPSGVSARGERVSRMMTTTTIGITPSFPALHRDLNLSLPEVCASTCNRYYEITILLGSDFNAATNERLLVSPRLAPFRISRRISRVFVNANIVYLLIHSSTLCPLPSPCHSCCRPKNPTRSAKVAVTHASNVLPFQKR